MMVKTPNPAWLSTAIVALAIALVAVACGADDEAEPTAVATQPTVATVATQPTVATPQTTQTPTTTAPPTTTPLVESAGSLEDLFITDTTTGREVMGRISQTERDCLLAAIREQLYGAMLELPMKRLVGEVGTSGAGSFLGCLTDDNVVLMGLVLIDSHHGRTDPEARECSVDAARENPEVIRVRFELLRPAFEATDADALFDSSKEIFDCLKVADQVDVLVRLTTRLDQEDTFTGQDIVAMLPEEEASCIRERVGEALFAVFLGATVTEAFAPAASLLDCLTLASKTALFAAFSSSRVDGLREEAGVCMATLVADSPHILALGFGALDVDELEESELARLGNEAARLFDCLNAEEVYQVLTLPAVVEQ
ncbi:MAG: hypothetical protein OXH89_01230 [bacterium]|nr:hypothetical protein [bacterium]